MSSVRLLRTAVRHIVIEATRAAAAGANPAVFFDVTPLYRLAKSLTFSNESEVIQVAPVTLSRIRFEAIPEPPARAARAHKTKKTATG